ncbi:hypothetical protein ACIGW8_26715 [Streptomyces sioyaensis]
MASKRSNLGDFFDDTPPQDVTDTKPDGRLLRVPVTRIPRTW